MAPQASPRIVKNAASISVLLVLRAKLDREGLAHLLQTGHDIQIVGEAANGAQALPLTMHLRPDVVIVDTTCLWPADSVRVADLLQRSPRTRVLALAAHDAAWCIVLNPPSSAGARAREGCNGSFECLCTAMQEGAHGALSRSSGSSELLQAVRALARGRFWLDSAVSLRVPIEIPLSDRERAVAWLVGQGCSNDDIARSLLISRLTVKKHVTHILQKTNLQDRLQLGLHVARHPSSFAGTRAEDRSRV